MCPERAPYIVGLVQAGRIWGTGVVITPKIIATAAHCVEYGPLGELPRAFFGEDFDWACRTEEVVEAHIHPHYWLDPGAFDLAVLVLKGTIPRSVQPIALCVPGTPWWDSSVMKFGGFGNNTTPGIPGSKKRIVKTRVKSVSDMVIWVDPSVSVPCHGDSGGPFVARIGESDVLIGIESGGDPLCHNEGRFVRLDSLAGELLRDWVRR